MLYPGLKSFPQYALQQSQATGARGLIAFTLKGGKQAAFKFLNALSIVAISNNLGDAKSLATHPATTTHSNISPEARAAIGITDARCASRWALNQPATCCAMLRKRSTPHVINAQACRIAAYCMVCMRCGGQ